MKLPNGAGVLIGALIVVYPFTVYGLLERAGAAAMAAVLGALLVLRVGWLRGFGSRATLATAALAAAFVLIVHLADSGMLLKLYPTLANTALATYCGYTLWRPPSAIERLARVAGMAVTDAGVRYTRGVTILWLGFFIVNGIIATLTAAFADLGLWALYNGMLSYAIVAVIFSLEWLYRRRYRRRHGELPPAKG